MTSLAPPAPDLNPQASALEARLPRLAHKVVAMWGTLDFEPFVSDLILDSRDGNRQGLPWEAAQELLFLMELSVARRAMVAAEATGMPFRQVFRQMMTNAEAAARQQQQKGWSDPMSNVESSREMRIAETAQAREAASSHRAPVKRKGFFARLFGR